MAVRFLKKALKTPATDETETRDTVARMLRELEQQREDSARAFASKLDNYEGNILVDRATIARAAGEVSDRLKQDIRFAHERVRAFAELQKASLHEFEAELSPGLWAGQKLIPVESAGCYVPGGRYAHIASAIMSITTAKVAGVANVVACSSPKSPNGIHSAVLYTMDLCGADQILCLGGVQGVAALAFGLFTGKPARIVVGPGNRFVAEAKRMLYGRVGIDLLAGPTEVLVIADHTADGEMIAQDLVGQAEHGPDSPTWLITTSEKAARVAMARVPELIALLPAAQRAAATAAWNDYGEVAVCDSREEAAALSDDYAPEHLELQTADNAWYVEHLRSYGSLFVGEQTTVAFGDKCSGVNHILPTKGAAHYTGGLSVHKFLKIVTTQRMTPEACREVAAVTARISRIEGMEAHARSADARLRKYFPRMDPAARAE
jgi:sulfopropanediol 3-dehydrogenase